MIFFNLGKDATLAEVYDIAFECFRSGEYDPLGAEPKHRRHLNDDESHESALRFILWLYCKQRGLSYGRVLKKVLLPRDFPEMEILQPYIARIKHTEVINFVSHETKITRNADTAPVAKTCGKLCP